MAEPITDKWYCSVCGARAILKKSGTEPSKKFGGQCMKDARGEHSWFPVDAEAERRFGTTANILFYGVVILIGLILVACWLAARAGY